MWLITTFGLFSLAEDPGQRGTGMLTIQSRVEGDMERLREHYLPGMSAIQANATGSYGYKATAPAAQVAAAVCRAVADINYSDLPGSVASSGNEHRATVYRESWKVMLDRLDSAPPPAATKPAGPVSLQRERTFGRRGLPDWGAVVFDGNGSVFIRKTVDDGQCERWTFCRGPVLHGEVPKGAVRRIVGREMGVDACEAESIPGEFTGLERDVWYYTMQFVQDCGDFDRGATSEVARYRPEEASELISQTRNAVCRQHDLELLAAACRAWAERNAKLAQQPQPKTAEHLGNDRQLPTCQSRQRSRRGQRRTNMAQPAAVMEARG